MPTLITLKHGDSPLSLLIITFISFVFCVQFYVFLTTETV